MNALLAFLIALSPVIVFFIFAFYFAYGHKFLATKLDQLLNGKLYDRIDTSLIVDHFCLQPEEWLLKGDRARYPKEGGRTIFTIEKDKKGYMLTYDQQDSFLLDRGRYFQKLEDNWQATFEVKNYEKFKGILWPDDSIIKLEDYRARNN